MTTDLGASPGPPREGSDTLRFLDDEEARGYQRHCLTAERLATLIMIPLTIGLYLAWAIFDEVLEPALAGEFFWIRVGFTVFSLGLLVVALRTRTLLRMRVVGVLLLVACAGGLAYMPPRVAHHTFYVFGFSLVFWGPGVILQWPARWATFAYALVFASHLVGQAAVTDSPRTTGELVGAAFYLGSAGILVSALAFVRKRLDLRTFLLGSRLDRRNQELASTLDQLRETQARLVETEKQSALGRLLAGLSHELNNPINVVVNNLPPLREHVEALVAAAELGRAADTTETQQRLAALWRERDVDFAKVDAIAALDAVQVASERVRRIHLDLRAFVRGDAIEPILADLNDGVRATIAMLTRSLPAGTRLDVGYGELPRAWFHPGQINQVALNLLQNAIEEVGPGGTVRIRTRVVDDAIELAISDSGKGVPAAVRDRIFEPFFTTKSVGKGTGLGLAIAREIVERGGGTLELLASDDLGGAHFSARLPLAAPAGSSDRVR